MPGVKRTRGSSPILSGLCLLACGGPSFRSQPPAVPHADIEGFNTALLGDTVRFDAGASTPGRGSIQLYSFSFGDVTPPLTQSGSTAFHAYTKVGTYAVAVVVTNDEGQSSVASKSIEISPNNPPVVRLNVPSNALTDAYLVFDATASSASDAVIQSYEFDFGDNTRDGPQRVASVSHAYAKAGSYHATVTAVDSRGASGAAAADIVVGFTLQTPINLSGTPTQSQGARLQLDTAGYLQVAWQESNSFVSFRRGGDSGLDFGAVVAATPDNQFFELDPGEGALTTDSGGASHLAWTWLDRGGNSEIYYVRSEDNGVNWGTPVRISDGDGLSAGASISALASGVVVVAWTNAGIQRVRPSTVRLSRSTNGSSSFGASEVLSAEDGGFCPAMVAGAGKNVVVAWLQGTMDNVMDVLIARSTDEAATFSLTLNLTGGERNRSCPSLWSDGSGTLIVSWIDYDSPGDPSTASHLQMRRSVDDGVTWEAQREIVSDTNIVCPHGSMRSDGTLDIAYSTFVFGARVYYENWLLPSTDAGTTFLGPLPIFQISRSAEDAEGGGCPAVAALPQGRFALSWSSLVSNAPTNLDVFIAVGSVSRH